MVGVILHKKLTITIITLLLFLNLAQSTYASVIHEVKSGESLWTISKEYNTSFKHLQEINGLSNGNIIVPGQALIIPGQTYIVKSGESLWDIAVRHSIDLQQLIKHNHLTTATIHANQKLKIPTIPKKKIFTGAFFVPKDKIDDEWMLNHYKNYISSAGFFEYHPDGNGKLSRMNGEKSIPLAWYKNIIPYATVTNLSEKGFDHELAHHLLSQNDKRESLINNIFNVLHKNDLKGVIIDFEGLKPKDRDNLNIFMKALAKKLHPVGMEIAIAVPPMQADKIPSWYVAFDYKTLGETVDFMFLMTYDWHWFGGPSGPIAPISEVRTAVEYAISVVPRSKIMLGIPMYAYDWKTQEGLQSGKAYSQSEALNNALAHQSIIHYDEKAKSPWFQYTDLFGDQHEVWFEDARSILAKYRLLKKYDLAGMGGWRLGMEFSQAEKLLLEEFDIRK